MNGQKVITKREAASPPTISVAVRFARKRRCHGKARNAACSASRYPCCALSPKACPSPVYPRCSDMAHTAPYQLVASIEETEMEKLELAFWEVRIKAAGSVAILAATALGVLLIVW